MKRSFAFVALGAFALSGCSLVTIENGENTPKEVIIESDGAAMKVESNDKNAVKISNGTDTLTVTGTSDSAEIQGSNGGTTGTVTVNGSTTVKASNTTSTAKISGSKDGLLIQDGEGNAVKISGY